MAATVFVNNWASTLDGAINDLETTITVATGDGAGIPTISGGTNQCYLTLDDGAGVIEIVRVTAHNSSTDEFTVVRGADGTSAVAWANGSTIEMRIVKANLDDFVSQGDASVILEGDLTVSGNITFAGGVGVPSGGTGLTTLTANALLVGQGVNDVTFLTPGADNTVVASTGTVWAAEAITSLVTKSVVDNALTPTPLGVAQGGTGRNDTTLGAIPIGWGTDYMRELLVGTDGQIVRSNGTYWVAASPAMQLREQVITASGTWTRPAGVTYVYVIVVGGGGRGGAGGNAGGTSGGGGGGGGGAGGVSCGQYQVSADVPVIVGVGASGGTPAAQSSFDGVILGPGGSNGSDGAATGAVGAGGDGGNGTGGTWNCIEADGSSGSGGEPSDGWSMYGGAGGAGAVPWTSGVLPRIGNAGSGGARTSGAGNAGTAATEYGAGGGGGGGAGTGTGGAGGAGCQGVVVVRWVALV